jgi:hypothetical protein
MLDTVPSSEEVPASLRLLAAEAVEALAADSATFHAVALYDERKDSVLEALPSFRAAQTALCEHPFVHDRFGTTECKRLTLHFVYQLFPRAGRSGVPRDLRRVWRNFLAEVQKPTWDYCGVANLRNFIVEPSTTVPVRLPDGVSIRGRSFEQNNTFGSGNVIDSGWVAGYLLLALAGLWSTTTRDRSEPRQEGRVSTLPVLLPYLPIGLGGLVAVVMAATGEAFDGFLVAGWWSSPSLARCRRGPTDSRPRRACWRKGCASEEGGVEPVVVVGPPPAPAVRAGLYGAVILLGTIVVTPKGSRTSLVVRQVGASR